MPGVRVFVEDANGNDLVRAVRIGVSRLVPGASVLRVPAPKIEKMGVGATLADIAKRAHEQAFFANSDLCGYACLRPIPFRDRSFYFFLWAIATPEGPVQVKTFPPFRHRFTQNVLLEMLEEYSRARQEIDYAVMSPATVLQMETLSDAMSWFINRDF